MTTGKKVLAVSSYATPQVGVRTPWLATLQEGIIREGSERGSSEKRKSGITRRRRDHKKKGIIPWNLMQKAPLGSNAERLSCKRFAKKVCNLQELGNCTLRVSPTASRDFNNTAVYQEERGRATMPSPRSDSYVALTDGREEGGAPGKGMSEIYYPPRGPGSGIKRQKNSPFRAPSTALT